MKRIYHRHKTTIHKLTDAPVIPLPPDSSIASLGWCVYTTLAQQAYLSDSDLALLAPVTRKVSRCQAREITPFKILFLIAT
jgi:hypothetical protein